MIFFLKDIASFSEEGKKLQELLALCMEGNSRDLGTSVVMGENVHVYKQNGSTKKVTTDFTKQCPIHPSPCYSCRKTLNIRIYTCTGVHILAFC